MGRIKIRRGLDLPIQGAPVQEIHDGNPVRRVALLGSDYPGMKPYFTVVEGDRVKLGQTLFTDKKNASIKFASPGCGKVVAINRGEKRAFLSVVIELDGEDAVDFRSYSEYQIASLDRKDVVSKLLESGQWTAIRSRPFGSVADPDGIPHSIFITAMDTNPLAPSVEKVLEGKEDDFRLGLVVLSKLTEGKVYLCKASGVSIPTAEIDSLSVEEFGGPHPAGNAGTHIHFLDPVHRGREVWHLGAQDVAAIGYLFKEGRILTERIVSLGGPSVKQPRLIRIRLGASLQDLTERELQEGDQRIVSGSVLSGTQAEESTGFLGRFDQQVTVLPEFTDLGFFGWVNPGWNLFSLKNILLSRFVPKKRLRLNTAQHGGERAIVPVGSYEKVMPLDLIPTYLLRALAAGDIDEAEKLGCLELVEEDLALCSLVCPSKIDHGMNLRKALMTIEKEG